MERHPGQEEKHVWGMVGSGCAQGRRLGDEIRGLDWFGKSWEGQTTGVGFILWLWSGRGQAGIWAQEEDGWGAPPARALQGTAKVQGRRLRGAMSWGDHKFCGLTSLKTGMNLY